MKTNKNNLMILTILLALIVILVTACSGNPAVDVPTGGSLETASSTSSSVGSTATSGGEPIASNEAVATPGLTVSLAELAVHNTEKDCWVGYKGEVYDVTSYVPRHPGGADQIIPLCGTANEFEKAFTGKHGTSKVGTLQRQSFKGKLVE